MRDDLPGTSRASRRTSTAGDDAAVPTTTGGDGGVVAVSPWRRLAPWGVAAGATAALAVLATVDPNEQGHYPTCPFLAGTGWFCPGCGTLRAMHALTHLDPVTAWQRNPLAVLAVPLIVLAWVRWTIEVARPGDSAAARAAARWHPTRIPARLVWALLVLVVTYWVARNIPGWTWLSPE